jgi:AraC family transcriptional regulator
MTPRRLMIVDDLIEAEMAGSMTVGSLAGALDLSTGFFIRAFRAGTGRTPHDYVMDRRVARARMLLQSTDLGLSSIAAACGFSSHAHMSTAFRRRLGVRPTAFRTT